jgi:hypothetical protein
MRSLARDLAALPARDWWKYRVGEYVVMGKRRERAVEAI